MEGLAQIAGGRSEVFQAAPGDRARYAAMGGVIVSTAAVAAASAVMAVRMAMGLSLVAALLIGLIWGVIIFNLDRLLVVQMMRQPRKRMSVFAALPRLMLALVLGTVISTPVVLQVFQPEIETELIVMQAEETEAYNRQIAASSEYSRIPLLEEQIVEDEKALADGSTVNVENDPAVVSARKLYSDAQKDYDDAENEVICEKEGKCGSGKPGAGIAFNEKVKRRDNLKVARDEAATELEAARTTARTSLTGAQTTARATTQARLTENKAVLADLKQRFEGAKRAHEAQSEQDDGLLARLEALHRLSGDRTTLLLAHVMLFLLFLSLELLPVFMKLLQVLGPETQYDIKAKEVDDNHARLAAERWDLEREIEHDRLQLIRDAAKASNQQVVDAQSQVMHRVLEAWEQYALRETERDVSGWQAKLAAPPEQDDNEPTTVQLQVYRTTNHNGDSNTFWGRSTDNDPTLPPSHGARRAIRGTASVGDAVVPPQRSVYGRHQAPADDE